MPLSINIKDLIANNVIESERIEFKEGWNPQSILHTICAFANDSSNIGGGYVIVGVAEDQGQASDEDLQRLMSLTAKVTFDNRVNHHATLDDLNLIHIAAFLKEVKSSLYPELPKIPLDNPCIQMGIARGSDEDIHPLNVALMLFNDEPRRFFRGAQIDLVEYKDYIGDNFSENIFTGTIQSQLRDVLRYLKNNLVKEYVQKVEGQAEANRFYNYPYEVLEEALANAIYHKSYDRQNPIEVNIRLDRIEIISYAGPMPPVNQKMLNSERVITRDYRNSRVGDFLKEMDLTEGRSTGIPKMRFFMKRNGSPEPVFQTDEDLNYFLVTLFPHPETLIKESIEQVTPQVTPKLNNWFMP